ncbi:MAG: HNH endonuclease, partial [Acidobacteria bacterium]|nr:HNH endonuclease [Acidobacteriota bacterium]
QGVAQLMKKAPFITQKQPTMSLNIDERFKDDCELYSDMEQFNRSDKQKVKDQIAANESKTFYCFAAEIEDIKEDLEKDPEIPGFYTRYGMDPGKISAIIFTEAKKKTKSKSQKIKIKIRVVPDDAEALQLFSVEFEKKTNLQLQYRGESEAVLMNRSVMELMVYKRRFVPPAIRDAVNKRCKGHCALCGDAYGDKFDVDHAIPLREGGLDDVSNMQALCRPCHAKKCEQEEVTCTNRLNTLASELSPEMLNMLHYSVKPKQVYWGSPTPKSSKVTAIDAVGCRTNAIVDSVDPLPVFCPLDAPELCHDQNNALRRDPMYYDYIYVDVPDGDRRDRFPYTGRRFYWKGSVRYMLDTGKIDKGHLKAGVRATNHVSPNTLNDAFKTIKEVYVHVIHLKKSWECIAPDEISPEEIVRGQKTPILACIGLWNSTEQCIWRKVKSAYESDAGGLVQRRKELDDGVFEFAWCVDLVSLRSMRPIGDIALQMEQVRIAEILDIMRPYELRKEIVRLGAVVDCVYFDAKPFVSLKVDVDLARLPSGAPKFQIKLEDANRSPVNWTKNPSILHQEVNFEPQEWKHYTDPTLDEMIAIIKERHGALVTGP